MKTVIVGMSGGVDSSVAAYLLKEQGYNVIGLFMRNWDSKVNNETIDNSTSFKNISSQEQDYNDAKKVCKKLNIPLYKVEFIKEYWDNVFTYFLNELKNGRTPNPDIMCNKYIKFDAFVKEAKKLGADIIATGHYSKIENNKLLKGKDKNKDQTYFLSQLSKKQLENVIFPIGDLTKKEVRNIAKNLELNIANKKDSTGICFIGERNLKQFLSNYLPSKQGDIIDIETNKILGKHIGLMYYTIGQRKGLEIGGSTDKIYVVGKNLNKNILYVAYGDNNEYLYSDTAIIDNINWISEKRVLKCKAKFRYRQPDKPVIIEWIKDNKILVKYKGLKAITPGQACVFYLDDECLGGGIVIEVQKNGRKLWYL